MEIVDCDVNDEDDEVTEIIEEDNIDDTSRRYTCPIAPRMQSMPNAQSSMILINLFSNYN